MAGSAATHLSQCVVQSLYWHVGASEVHHGLNAKLQQQQQQQQRETRLWSMQHQLDTHAMLLHRRAISRGAAVL
jgi:hypothetical protein